MAYQNPSVAEFKVYFSRDFPFGDDPEVNVTDADIVKAFGQTNMGINQALFSEQANYTIGYNLLAAHWLTIDLRASSQGMQGKFAFLEASKSVGSVSVSYSIPEWVLKNPYFGMLMSTNYGAKYLTLLMPKLVGAAYVIPGSTRP